MMTGDDYLYFILMSGLAGPDQRDVIEMKEDVIMVRVEERSFCRVV